MHVNAQSDDECYLLPGDANKALWGFGDTNGI